MTLFKKFFMPCGLCAAVPVFKPGQTPDKVQNEQKTLVRPSELPIYKFEPIDTPKAVQCQTKPNILEENFGVVRKSVQEFLHQFSSYTSVVSNTIETGKAHSQMTLEMLREETNVLPRIGAVGVGGLSGLILGLRGGKFKKLVYSTTGALIVASICYPKQAQEGMILAKYYMNVGYNFFYGVKPGDANQMEISWPQLPKVPTNLSEVTEVAGDVAGVAASAVGTLASKLIQTLSDFAETPKPGKVKPDQ
ncbi:MICOS complex subunit MIC27 [Trichogramma pretiosum]|uniref:MICOS complex subunit MIC27 n=1 Tax=Trichogramma pretiosum TaxID=7493 RepID=UPI0006C9DE19|nr:MICOS complex subunit MIC27 [Trichogramma pretiosum]